MTAATAPLWTPADARLTPGHFAAATIRDYKLPRHVRAFNRVAMELAQARLRGEQAFVCVEASRRHGKSQFWSRAFPAWWKGTFPDDGVIQVGYAQDFIEQWGRAARNLVRDHGAAVWGHELDYESRAITRWELKGHEHRCIAVGVGGALTGETGHLIVIDDPVKGWAEAQSVHYRELQKEWYGGTLRSILEPNGVIVLVMSRWHEDDLAGWLQRESEDAWRVIRFPALAEPTPAELAQLADAEARRGWRDALGRAEGEPLWPQRYPKETLERFARGQPLVWAASWQQRPSSAEGGEFRRADWRYVDHLPWHLHLDFVRRWDLAGTKPKRSNADPDWTVGALMARDELGNIYVVDVQRFRADSAEVRRRVGQTAHNDTYAVPVRMARDPGQAGQDQAADYARTVLKGYDFATYPEIHSKETRAAPWAAAVAKARPEEGGQPMVFLVRGGWCDEYVEEHRQFPTGVHDDQVDASANGYLDLVGGYGDDGFTGVVESTSGGR